VSPGRAAFHVVAAIMLDGCNDTRPNGNAITAWPACWSTYAYPSVSRKGILSRYKSKRHNNPPRPVSKGLPRYFRDTIIEHLECIETGEIYVGRLRAR